MKRATVDRRSGKDRRRRLKRGRLQGERRTGWVRINKWSSVKLRNLKISKFLKSPEISQSDR